MEERYSNDSGEIYLGKLLIVLRLIYSKYLVMAVAPPSCSVGNDFLFSLLVEFFLIPDKHTGESLFKLYTR